MIFHHIKLNPARKELFRLKSVLALFGSNSFQFTRKIKCIQLLMNEKYIYEYKFTCSFKVYASSIAISHKT
jgi:hypothetical protein